jgi:hypothetical protein
MKSIKCIRLLGRYFIKLDRCSSTRVTGIFKTKVVGVLSASFMITWAVYGMHACMHSGAFLFIFSEHCEAVVWYTYGARRFHVGAKRNGILKHCCSACQF